MYQFINYKKVIKFFFIFFLYFPISNFSYSNIVDELTTLNNLYKEGAITKEEFSKAKSLILKSSQNENIENLLPWIDWSYEYNKNLFK